MDTITSTEALSMLLEGNKRFSTSNALHPRQDDTRRNETSSGQSPFAAILTCADSRVAPEILFDQGLGDLFVVRVAGNILNEHIKGSLEYAVLHLNTPLIVVLGHTKCGMITGVAKEHELDGSIASLAPVIEPHVENVRQDDGNLVYNATVEVARQTARQLSEAEPILAERVKEGKLKVIPAMYDIETGEVELL